MTLNDIFLQLCDIDRKAQTLIADAGFDYEDGLGCKACSDPDDPEGRFLRKTLENLLVPFEELHAGLDCLRTPTHGEYRLERFPDGRYGYFDSHGIRHIFTCGSPIEAKIPDGHGHPCWVQTRIEHDGNDYFLWLHGSVPLKGLTVRERW